MDTNSAEYEAKIFHAVWEAIGSVSKLDVVKNGKPVAMLHGPECINALIHVMAVLMSLSKSVTTPAQVRQHCEKVAKTLRERTIDARREGIAEKTFGTIRDMDTSSSSAPQ